MKYVGLRNFLALHLILRLIRHFAISRAACAYWKLLPRYLYGIF